MKESITERLASLYKTLGETNRLKILKILSSHMAESLCVGDVSGLLNISQPLASQHLKVLKTAGLIEENKKGSRVYYTVNMERMHEAKDLIDDTFIKAFKKCSHNLQCGDCPVKDTCA